MDFTNNSGVQDPLLQAPRAMAHESNQRKTQLGCSPYEYGYQGLINKGSCSGKQAPGRPFHLNPGLITKRKWRLLTHHQPSYSKSALGEGVLQDGGTAGNDTSNTAGRLHDEIRPEGCILHTSNTFPQKVSEVKITFHGKLIIWFFQNSREIKSGFHVSSKRKRSHLIFHGKKIRPFTSQENTLYHPLGLKEKSQGFPIFYDVSSPLKSKSIIFFSVVSIGANCTRFGRMNITIYFN